MQRERRPTTFWPRGICYAGGDAGFNLYWVLAESFLLFFYTDVFRLSAGAVAVLVVLGRGTDLVAGFAIGAAADRTRSRFGHYRPYLLWFTLPLAVAVVLLFSAPSTWPSSVQRVTQANNWPIRIEIVASVLFALFYSAANIPYTAMLAVIAVDPKERTSLASTRFAGAAASAFFAQAMTLPLVNRLSIGDPAQGWQRVAILYAVLASIALLTCFKGTREVITPSINLSRPTRDLHLLFACPEWWSLFLATIIAIASFSCRSAVSIYYMRYVVQRPELTSMFLAGGSIAAFAACVLVPLLPSTLRPGRGWAAICAFAGALCCSLLLVAPPSAWITILSLQVCFGLCTGTLVPAIFALFAEMPDHVASLRGLSLNGLIAATSLLALKLGGLCGTTLVALILSHAGYRAGVAQSLQVRHVTLLLISLLPGSLLAASALILRSASRSEIA